LRHCSCSPPSASDDGAAIDANALVNLDVKEPSA
jgi:hypothetical protein